MGGIATCLHLRNEAGDGRLPQVPVLMLLDRDADVHLARRSGAEGWLVKPLDAFALRAKAVEVLGAKT
jgi:DNA-binding response OmpR family regulator